MRGPSRKNLSAALLFASALLVLLVSGCEPREVETSGSVSKTSAALRAERRLFDGAPPVIPHLRLGAACISCHNDEGMAVEALGFAPPSPHELTAGLSAVSHCEQCHVFQRAQETWVESTFVAWPQDLRAGERFSWGSPPVMPHGSLMRENCKACHSGPAAREEIRTDHPERLMCSQCHVERVAGGAFRPRSS